MAALFWWFARTDYCDVGEALVAEIDVQACDKIAPHLLDVHPGFWFKSEVYCRWPCLDELAAMRPRYLVDNDRNSERGKSYRAPVRSDKAQNIVTPTSDPMAGRGLPHGQGLGRTSTESPRS